MWVGLRLIALIPAESTSAQKKVCIFLKIKGRPGVSSGEACPALK